MSDRGIYEINGVNITFLSYWTEPWYRLIIVPDALSNGGKPVSLYHNRRKNQVWVIDPLANSVDGAGSFLGNIVVMDYINRDELGQPATTTYDLSVPNVTSHLLLVTEVDITGMSGASGYVTSLVSGYIPFGAYTGSGAVDIGAFEQGGIGGYVSDYGGSGFSVTPGLQTGLKELENPYTLKATRYARVIADANIVAGDTAYFYTSSTPSYSTSVIQTISAANTKTTIASGLARGQYVAIAYQFGRNGGHPFPRTLFGLELEYIETPFRA
jgi:hypothetical protein